MSHTFRPSLTELALTSKRVLIMGIGGGGDVIQAIPVINYLKLLGVQEFYVGGVSCSWWTPDGHPLSLEPGLSVYGPTIYDVKALEPHETWAPQMVGITKESNLKGRQPAEAVLADMIPGKKFTLGLQGGAAGMAESLKIAVERFQIELIVAVDIGSDSFHDGKEASKAHTSLVDFLSLGALIQQTVPVVYALAGYGADGEMQLDELDERVGRVMRAGGFLGSFGLTQRDAAEILTASEVYPDPVEAMSARAARGELGLKRVDTHGPWGTVIRVTPLTATVLCFDPRVVAETVSTGILKLMHTTSLAEAEKIYRDELGEIPETTVEPLIRFFRS
jgi:hypothetical protein